MKLAAMSTQSTHHIFFIRVFGCFFAALLVTAGCADEEINPLTTGTGGSTTTSSSSTGGAGGQGGGDPTPTVVRTVEQRNPFGNVTASDNLLWDGDFEWKSPFSDQYGWYYGPPYGYTLPAATIGAECQSGVKCITVPKNKALIGIGVGVASGGLEISVHVKPKLADCSKVDVALLDIDSFQKDSTIAPTSAAPSASGWCLYKVEVASYPSKVYLLMDNNTGDSMVVDNAVVKKVNIPQGPPPPPASISPQVLSRRNEARASLPTLQGPIIPPKTPAQRAFEEHLSR
ncbi:MAG: hypothetical protein IPK82_39120 [Polyangiaceae bacterium]|nr:hypothetical protein [Polyangiaceae bacterium]